MMSAASGLPVTVTYLQMHRPADRYPHAPMGHQLALFRCRDIPLHFYRYLYDRVGRDWHWTAALLLDDEQLAKRLNNADREIHALYLNGAPAGFFELHHMVNEECRLVHFGLMRHAIGLGLSRWFLGCAIQSAWEANPRVVSVETCTLDHPAALPLYQKMGFTPVRRAEASAIPITAEQRAEALLRG